MEFTGLDPGRRCRHDAKSQYVEHRYILKAWATFTHRTPLTEWPLRKSVAAAVVVVLLFVPQFAGRQNQFSIDDVGMPTWLGWVIWANGALMFVYAMWPAPPLEREALSTRVMFGVVFGSIVGAVFLFSAIAIRSEAANLLNNTSTVVQVTFDIEQVYEPSANRHDWFSKCPHRFTLRDAKGYSRDLCFESNLFPPIKTDVTRFCKGQQLELRGRVSSLGFAVDFIRGSSVCEAK